MKNQPTVKVMGKDHPCYKYADEYGRLSAEAWSKAAIMAKELATLKAENKHLKEDLKNCGAAYGMERVDREEAEAENERLQTAIADALGRHQVTHIHAALKKCAVDKDSTVMSEK